MKRLCQACVLFILVVPVASAAANRRTCPSAITKDVALSFNDYVSCQLDAPGETVFFRFQGTADQLVMIAMIASYKYGPCFAVFDPSGARVKEVCQWGSDVSAGEILLTQTGIYTIRAWDNGFNDLFSFGLYLERIVPQFGATPISYGQTVTDRIDPGLETDQYTFTGSSGDSVAVQMTANNKYGPAFAVLDPSGKVIQETAQWGSSVARLEFILPMTGTYLLRLYDNGRNDTFDYTVLLQCLGACSRIPPVYPTATLPLTGCTTCKPGDTFSAKLATTNFPDKTTELKIGFYFPDNTQHAAGDPHLELPPGFSFNGDFLRLPITAAHPKGNYRVCARIVEIAAGDILTAACQSFVVQ